MRPGSGQIAFRHTLGLALISWTLVSCAGGPPPPNPPAAGGPPFVINSPEDGSSISGTVFFSAQPFDPGTVREVSFRAGDTELGVDDSAADGFRIFLDSTDFPAGELELTATLRGKNGRTTVHAVTVENVPAPPSQATVTASGAALGTDEENGALSTLIVPAGAPVGVEVGFAARSQDQVFALTGVDYDALGVTFLGAQQIATSDPLGVALGVTSGGFGPMVQPEQVVVNYSITPDADGDGIGELMVVNTASVTPGGDVISDPQELVQLGENAITTDRAGSRFRTLQDGLSGAPGTRLAIEVRGLTPTSLFGNLAVWTSGVDGEVMVVPGAALPDPDDPSRQRFATVIPPLAPGPAELRIAGADGFMTDPIEITVLTASVPAGGYAPLVEQLLDGLEAYGASLEPTSAAEQERIAAAAEQLALLRSEFARLETLEVPDEVAAEVETALGEVAIMIENSGVLAEFAAATAGLAPQYDNLDDLAGDMAGLLGGVGAVLGGLASLVGGILASGPLLAALGIIAGAFAVYTGILITLYFLCKLIGGGYCLSNPPPPPCKIAPGTPPAIWAPGTPPAPEEFRRQQAGPGSTVTGMGSLVPPGGDSCGTVMGDDAPEGSSLRRETDAVGLYDPLGDRTGRFVVKVFYGAGNSVPFSGVSDASGYFYLPTIPAGQPFEAIAYDTATGETRSLEGIGPEIGESTYLFFDFLSEGASGGDVIAYDTNTAGTYGDVDIFLFEGRAGDLINLAVFSEELNVGGFDFELSAPDGSTMLSGTTSGGHLFEVGAIVPVELERDGLYAFSLDGTAVSGDYTLGLALLDPPAPIDVADPLIADLSTLGDRHYYSFPAVAGDALEVTLGHDGGSTLAAELNVRSPDPALDFHQGPILLRLRTDEAQRSRTGSRAVSDTGEHIVEVRMADTFAEDLALHLGTYRVDLSLQPPP